MNVSFVAFQYHDLQANRDFQKIITQARKKNTRGFLHLVHLNDIFQNKLIKCLDPPDSPLSFTFRVIDHFVAQGGVTCHK